jgi:hypothetical protein
MAPAGMLLAKSLIVFCALATTATIAQAKRTPFAQPEQASQPSPDAWSIYLGPAGAMLESDYFSAPHGFFNSRHIAPCRLHRRSADNELHLAYSCQ